MTLTTGEGQPVFEPYSTVDVAIESWDKLEAELAETIGDLADRAFVVVARRPDPAQRQPAPPIGWRRLVSAVEGLVSGPKGDGQPFVQFSRIGEHLMAECCGPLELGGYVELSTDQQTRILTLGWADLRGRDKRGWQSPNYRAYFPHEGTPDRISWDHKGQEYCDLVDAAEVARLAIATLRGPLAVVAPDDLKVVRS